MVRERRVGMEKMVARAFTAGNEQYGGGCSKDACVVYGDSVSLLLDFLPSVHGVWVRRAIGTVERRLHTLAHKGFGCVLPVATHS